MKRKMNQMKKVLRIRRKRCRKMIRKRKMKVNLKKRRTMIQKKKERRKIMKRIRKLTTLRINVRSLKRVPVPNHGMQGRADVGTPRVLL